MLQRVDPAVGGDGAELADLGIDRFRMALEIGKVAQRHLAQDAALADGGVASRAGTI